MDEYKLPTYFLYDSFVHDYINFKQLIDRFFRQNSRNILNDIQLITHNKKITNDDFYDIYRKYVTVSKSVEKKVVDVLNRRQTSFIDSVEKLLKISNIKLNDIVYIDYGCNNGMFTHATAKHFNIPAKNVWAVDLIDKPHIIKEKCYNYVKLDVNNLEESLSQLPECNLITIINVIHHIPFDVRDNLLKILDKKIQHNATIIIKEHDCESQNKFANYIAEWHKLYKILYNESDAMGELYLMNVNQLAAYMMLLHANLKAKFYDYTNQTDILKSYYAIFRKENRPLFKVI